MDRARDVKQDSSWRESIPMATLWSRAMEEHCPKHGPGYTGVQYNTRSHLGVIFQRHGSVWPRVFPFCAANVVFTLACRYLLYPWMLRHGVVVSGAGHTTSNFIVAFFVVSRVGMALKRNDEGHANLFQMTSSARELVSTITVATKDDQSPSAKRWRSDVAYYTCLLLRLCMCALDYEDASCQLPWAVPELKDEMRGKLRRYNQLTGEHALRYAHAKRSLFEEICRTPIALSYHLRLAIAEQKRCLDDALHPMTMTRVNGLVDKMIEGYLGQVRNVAFPLPFSLVQMARTLLFLWVLTLPIATQADPGSPLSHCFAVFFLTYAFLGLEVLSVDLENPFGKDDSDVNNLALAKTIFEDAYMMIDVVDGAEWAQKLRQSMSDGTEDAVLREAPSPPPPTESSPLIVMQKL